jgi:DUF971 family protein
MQPEMPEPVVAADPAPVAPDHVPVAKRPTPGWVPPVLAALVFLVIVGVGGLMAMDGGLRNAEMNALVTRVEASEDAMGTLQGNLGATFDEFAGQGQLTAVQRADLDAQIAQVAQEGHDDIQRAGDGVEAVGILPWHRDILRAKAAYVRHNHAWQDYLAKAAQDPSEVTRKQAEINDSFAAAEPLMTSAVPVPPLYSLQKRVALIFAPPPETTSGSGPTQSVTFRGVFAGTVAR